MGRAIAIITFIFLDAVCSSYSQNTFAPKISFKPESPNGRFDYKSGDQIVIHCEVSGVPAPTVDWIRDNGLAVGSAPQPYRNVLQIARASAADSGAYTCRARNSVGVDTKIIYIFVQGTTETTPHYPTPPPPSMPIVVNIAEPFDHSVAIGSTIRLTCSATSLRQKPVRLSWTKKGANSLPERAHDDGNGHLAIVNAVVADSGTYICNAFDQESYVTKNVSVTVQDAIVPRISFTPDAPNGRFDYKSGDPILINCAATTVPTPIVEWIRENGLPVGSATQPGQNALRIARASAADTGTYICRARNSRGVDERRIYIFVQGSGTTENTPYCPPSPSTPYIVVNISEPFDHSVTVGSTIRLTCSAVSLRQRPVKISWSKKGDSLPKVSAYDNGNGQLVIVKAAITDSGTYTCTALDNEYYVTKDVSVTVQDSFPPKVIITPDTPNGRLDYKSGDLILINCEAPGLPTPTIEWSRDNGPPIGRPGYPNRNALRITQASRADSGTYTCRARSSLGVDEKRINIFVQDS